MPGNLTWRHLYTASMMLGKLRWRRFSGVCSIPNNLTSERFEHLEHQVTQLASDTEEKLNVFIELIDDKVLSQRGERYVTFHRLLLRKCERKIQNDQHRGHERSKLDEERSLGNMKFIRKLFKLQMIKENIVQFCGETSETS